MRINSGHAAPKKKHQKMQPTKGNMRIDGNRGNHGMIDACTNGFPKTGLEIPEKRQAKKHYSLHDHNRMALLATGPCSWRFGWLPPTTQLHKTYVDVKGCPSQKSHDKQRPLHQSLHLEFFLATLVALQTQTQNRSVLATQFPKSRPSPRW